MSSVLSYREHVHEGSHRQCFTMFTWSTPPQQPHSRWLCSCHGGGHSPRVWGPGDWHCYTWRGEKTWRCQAPFHSMAKEVYQVSRRGAKDNKSTPLRWWWWRWRWWWWWWWWRFTYTSVTSADAAPQSTTSGGWSAAAPQSSSGGWSDAAPQSTSGKEAEAVLDY